MADSSDNEADADGDAMTVLDRFLSADISREELDSHLAAGRIAVGQRISDPATPAPAPISVQIMLDLAWGQQYRSNYRTDVCPITRSLLLCASCTGARC